MVCPGEASETTSLAHSFHSLAHSFHLRYGDWVWAGKDLSKVTQPVCESSPGPRFQPPQAPVRLLESNLGICFTFLSSHSDLALLCLSLSIFFHSLLQSCLNLPLLLGPSLFLPSLSPSLPLSLCVSLHFSTSLPPTSPPSPSILAMSSLSLLRPPSLPSAPSFHTHPPCPHSHLQRVPSASAKCPSPSSMAMPAQRGPGPARKLPTSPRDHQAQGPLDLQPPGRSPPSERAGT